ncbi:MAG: WYL domain-containing protein [Comamonadaceae bacterium]|nr:WYL domain-containing protein [Comamonadaceae bacterium]
MLGSGDGRRPRRCCKRVKIVSPAAAAGAQPVLRAASARRCCTRRRSCTCATSRAAAARSSERDVSPQRLVHYRNTWYLDAWCHRARSGCGASRSTPSSRPTLLDDAGAARWRSSRCEAEMDAGYGIYAGGQAAAGRRCVFDAAGGAVGQPRAMAPGAAGPLAAPTARYELRAARTSTRPSW